MKKQPSEDQIIEDLPTGENVDMKQTNKVNAQNFAGQKSDEIEEEILKGASSDEDIYSIGSGHFLTGEEGHSSSFGEDLPHATDLNHDSGNDIDSDQTWVQQYCSQRGHEMLCEIDDNFLFDESSTNGMRPWECMEYSSENENTGSKQQNQENMIFKQALSLIENQYEPDSKQSYEIK